MIWGLPVAALLSGLVWGRSGANLDRCLHRSTNPAYHASNYRRNRSTTCRNRGARKKWPRVGPTCSWATRRRGGCYSGCRRVQRRLRTTWT